MNINKIVLTPDEIAETYHTPLDLSILAPTNTRTAIAQIEKIKRPDILKIFLEDNAKIVEEAGWAKLSIDQNMPQGLSARLNLSAESNYIFGKTALDKTGYKRVEKK